MEYALLPFSGTTERYVNVAKFEVYVGKWDVFYHGDECVFQEALECG